MSRMFGTVSIGLRAPIIREGDDMVKIVTETVMEAMKEDGLTPRDRDIVAMTDTQMDKLKSNCSDKMN